MKRAHTGEAGFVVSRRLLIWLLALVLVVGGLLWLLFYGVHVIRDAWMNANELHARQTLASLGKALDAYHKRFDGYPDKLERLGGVGAGAGSPERAGLLAGKRAQSTFEESGYRFHYTAGVPQQRWAATVQLHTDYHLSARPLNPGGSGRWFYFAGSDGAIHQRQGEPAGPDDPLAPADPASD